MNSNQILTQAAEAIIYKDGNKVVKDRISKSYRIKELDDKIRKSRTKSETKLLIKASEVVNVPLPLTNKNRNERAKASQSFQIIMPFIDGKKLSEHLDEFPLTKQKQILEQIGQDVAKLHNADIIHSDLTTSNMILVENNSSASQKNKAVVSKKIRSCTSLDKRDLTLITNKISANECEPNSEKRDGKNQKIFFIDFGLGFISKKIEDKAVDIHLLRQALEAKHFKNWEILFKEFINGYKKNYSESKKILERLKAVEKRGRYKH